MPQGKRAPGQTQITISMPVKLMEEITIEAKADNRSRSNWIVTELTAAVKLKRRLRGEPQSFGAAGEKPNALADGPSTPSTPRFSPDALRLNEEPSTPGPRARSTRGLKTIIGPKKETSAS